MLNSNIIRNFILMACGAFLAIWMGMSIVTEQTATLIKIAAVSLFLICLLLGQKVWLLMILFSAMNVVLISGFGSTEIGQALFLGFSIVILMMRRLNLRPSFGELEIWMFLITASIVQAYVRNPVGLNIFGAGSVGAKPYISISLTIASGFLLSQLKVEPRHLKLAMWFSFYGALVGIPLNILRSGSLTGAVQAQGDTGTPDGGANRIGVLSVLANAISRILVCYISPLRSVFHPVWGILLFVSLVSAAMSGYRNAVATILLTYTLGLFYRGGFISVIISMFAGVFLLSSIALINLNFPLPANIQRAMSPFPGTWQKEHVQDAENSSEWRFEMWKEALTSERWIRNKILGDGLGLSRADLEANIKMSDLKIGRLATGLTAQQESMLVDGSYHSGPVHTIRTVGYVGLLILLLAMIRLASHAHRLIVACKGTEWFSLALFFGVPVITLPIVFVFIFGEYPSGVASWSIGMATISLIRKNIIIEKI